MGDCAESYRSAKISNVITMETLLLYNSDSSPGSCSHHGESSKAVCHDDNDGTMVGRRKCLQRWKRVG
jgi:hypothetical protein